MKGVTPKQAKEQRMQAAMCDGKKGYDKWADAARVVLQWHRQPNGDNVNVYRCRYCQQYHVGSRGVQ